jgi:hypothetical protein
LTDVLFCCLATELEARRGKRENEARRRGLAEQLFGVWFKVWAMSKKELNGEWNFRHQEAKLQLGVKEILCCNLFHIISEYLWSRYHTNKTVFSPKKSTCFPKLLPLGPLLQLVHTSTCLL